MEIRSTQKHKSAVVARFTQGRLGTTAVDQSITRRMRRNVVPMPILLHVNTPAQESEKISMSFPRNGWRLKCVLLLLND